MARRARRSAWTSRSDQVVSAPRRRRKRLPFVLAGILVLAGALVGLLQRRSAAPPSPVPQATSQAVSAPTAPSAAPVAESGAQRKATPAPQIAEALRKATPMTEQQVARVVDERNAAAREQRERFAADGWTPVAMPPPDQGVLELDPRLLENHETELRKHLETNSLGDGQLENAATIAVEAEEARTRAAAIQALGRSHSPRAQEILRTLFDDVEDDQDRRLVLGFVKPANLSDPSVEWILAKLQAPHLSDEFKKQMTFSLVLAEIAESKGDHRKALPKLLERVPLEWRQQVLSTYHTITQN